MRRYQVVKQEPEGDVFALRVKVQVAWIDLRLDAPHARTLRRLSNWGLRLVYARRPSQHRLGLTCPGRVKRVSFGTLRRCDACRDRRSRILRAVCACRLIRRRGKSEARRPTASRCAFAPRHARVRVALPVELLHASASASKTRRGIAERAAAFDFGSAASEANGRSHAGSCVSADYRARQGDRQTDRRDAARRTRSGGARARPPER